jgi:uncharacterized cupredoxin-like copper-binding protein
MKNLLLILLAIVLSGATTFAQSDIKMRFGYGTDNADLMDILYFENIGLGKMSFSGNDLKNKDFQISIRKFVNGKLAKTEVVFDSKEDEYFKIKSDKFGFRVLTKVTPENTAKFQFQFSGFSKQKEYKLAPHQKEFALKSFLGRQPEISLPLNKNAYILTYMMPYVKKDGSSTYCEVAQSGVNPEELGKIYPIPVYFLIDIKFL